MEYIKAKNMNDYIMSNIEGLVMTGTITRNNSFINELEYLTTEDLTNVILDFSHRFKMTITLNNMSHCQFYLTNTRLFVDVYKVKNDYEMFYNKLLRDNLKHESEYLIKLAKNKGYDLSVNGLYYDGFKINVCDIKSFYNLILDF